MRRILSFVPSPTSMRETTLSIDVMILGNIFKQVVMSLRGAPGHGFGRPKASAPRQRFAARRFGLACVTFFGAALATLAPARADTLVPPFLYATTQASPDVNQTQTGAGPDGVTAYSTTTIVNYPCCGQFTDSASALAFLSPSPSVYALVDGTGDPSESGSPGALSSVSYDWQIVPPVGASTTLVPIDVKYAIASSFSAGSIFAVRGSVQIGTGHGSAFIPDLDMSNSICDSAFLDPSDLFPTLCYSYGVTDPLLVVDEKIGFYPGVAQTVELEAYVAYSSNSGIDIPPSVAGSVTIDPTFTIDPAFLAENPGYSLEFSPGIGDSPTTVPTGPALVPEPATWTMMLVGFGGLGAAMSVTRHSRGFRHST